MINIFYYDLDKYDIVTARDMFQTIKNMLPEDALILALPKDTYFYENIDISYLHFLRQQIDEIVEEYYRKRDI